MPRTTLPISLGFYVSSSLPISAQRAVNLRPNIPQTQAVTTDNLFNTPGLTQLTTEGVTVSTRGSHVMEGIPYFVIGGNLFRLNRLVQADGSETFTTTSLGVIEGTERVYMADNGTQLCVVAIPEAGVTLGISYIYTAAPDTLSEITRY